MFESLASCSRIMVGLSYMFFITSIMPRMMELIWRVFHVIMWICMVEVCVGCVMMVDVWAGKCLGLERIQLWGSFI